jgi:uncharacterized protein YprB with RNaseH-like and TPR domain
MTRQDEAQRRLRRLERLRKIGVRKGVAEISRKAPPPPQMEDRPVEDPHLPGEEVWTPHGPAWVREVRFPLSEHGELAEWLRVAPESLAALDRNELLLDLVPAQAAFIDTETTGLSLGAGTYTFLIGIGAYEPPAVENACGGGGEPGDAFVVRQFFMRHPGEERAQLHLVEEALGRATGIVSFNGRGFDMPLINNRFVLASMPPPLAGAPHLDLLPPARRLWKVRWGSCSLGSLERNVLGLQRSTEDVPGYLIPDIYRQYYLTGAATEMLARVFYHNLQDVVSMALLGARMARYFRREALDAFVADLDPAECVSLGRCYDTLGWVEASVRSYRVALQRPAAAESQVLALRELSLLYKRLAWREQAAELWEEWVSTVAGEDLTPYVELAKHHEWHTGELAAARGWAAWALRIAEGWPPGFAREDAVAQLGHRLARIERKLVGLNPGEQEEVEREA